MRALAIPSCLLSLALWGQARNANWVFPDGMWMQFTDSSMVVLPSPYSGAGRSSCISDTAGQFLLLVDDTGIRDAQFNLLPGASAAELGWTGPGSSYLILPMPGAPTHYGIFVNELPPDARAGIVEVDLAANGGSGGVVTPGTTWYMEHATAKLTATADAEGSGYWVVQHADSGDVFNAFHLTNIGFNTMPVVSHAGRSYLADAPVFINADTERPMKFSFQGDKLAAITLGNEPDSNALELFHFDRANGTLNFWARLNTNLYTLNAGGILVPWPVPANRMFIDCEFSPDGLKLYYQGGDTTEFSGGSFMLVQMDLQDPAPDSIQESAFFVIGNGAYNIPGLDLTGSFMLTGANGILYARNNYYNPEYNMLFDGYGLPGLTMDSLSGPLHNPLIDIFGIIDTPFDNFVGNLPNICKRYVDSPSWTTGINGPKANAGLRIWPNPNTGHCIVYASTAGGTATARLMDATGRTLPGTWTLRNGDNALDLSGLADGTYVLCVQQAGGVHYLRLVKQ